jgi:hypothetical protein
MSLTTSIRHTVACDRCDRRAHYDNVPPGEALHLALVEGWRVACGDGRDLCAGCFRAEELRTSVPSAEHP